MNGLWRLSIIDKNGGTKEIFGTEEVTKAPYEQWKEYLDEALEREYGYIEIHGMCDSADRAESQLIFLIADIRAVYVTRIY